MNSEPDPREDKLPKWAQQELKLLRRRLGEVNASLARHHATSGKTRVWYGDELNEDLHYIPEKFPGADHDIIFDLGADGARKSIQNQITVCLRKDYEGVLGLEIRGGRSVAILPTASNTARVEFRR